MKKKKREKRKKRRKEAEAEKKERQSMYRSCLPSISTVYSDNNHHHNHGILHASTQIKKQTLIKCSSDAKNARRTKELQVRQSERKKENEV